MRKIIILLVMVPLLGFGQRKNLISEHTFDESVGSWFENSMFYPYSANVSTYTKRNGKSIKVELRKGENIRAEFGTDSRVMPKEAWYGFSVFLPSSYVKDVSPEGIAQWHSFPDVGEAWRSPPVALIIVNDRFELHIRTDSDKISSVNGTFEKVDLGLVGKSSWIDFVVHAKWSWDNTGVLELWKNDKLVYSRVGRANCYNDVRNPYFKIGIYKWEWEQVNKSTTTSRVLYYDEVRIGSALATYNDVYSGRKLIKTIQYYSDGSIVEK